MTPRRLNLIFITAHIDLCLTRLGLVARGIVSHVLSHLAVIFLLELLLKLVLQFLLLVLRHSSRIDVLEQGLLLPRVTFELCIRSLNLLVHRRDAAAVHNLLQLSIR